MKRFKMGVFNNLQLHDNFDIKDYIKSFNEKNQTGFKLDKNNNYDMQQKRLANLAEAVDAADAITKHQMEVGLSNKSDQTNVLLFDGRNHMTGDLDMRGNKITNLPIQSASNEPATKDYVDSKVSVAGDLDMKNCKIKSLASPTAAQDAVNKKYFDEQLLKSHLVSSHIENSFKYLVEQDESSSERNIIVNILPGEIDMNRKLITNLDTDQNQDLSAVNMVTLKTNIGQKVDKKYVDDENAKFVKKTGDTLSGDLILPHDSYPVQGNTNKAVSYETQREIFLSRKESFPMETDINMNNNFVQNVATPTTSHQGVNKGYCDYNFLNKQKGGMLMG